MPRVIVTAYKISRHDGVFTTIELGLGQKPPQHIAEIKTVEDAKRELLRFAQQMEATGQPWQVSARLAPNSGRAPKGFRAAEKRDLTMNVNLHLAPKK